MFFIQFKQPTSWKEMKMTFKEVKRINLLALKPLFYFETVTSLKWLFLSHPLCNDFCSPCPRWQSLRVVWALKHLKIGQAKKTPV